MKHTAIGRLDSILRENSCCIEWTEEQRLGVSRHTADGFWIRVITMRMGGNENIDVKILGLDKNGELPIDPVGIAIGCICTTVGQVQIDSYQQAALIFDKESILSEIPDRKAPGRRT
jgi:hypothetical protein